MTRLAFLVLLIAANVRGSTGTTPAFFDAGCGPVTSCIEAGLSAGEAGRPSPLLHFLRGRQARNRKVTAAILAFPFPFGIVALHRIYLGTAPYVPVVYIATFGGVLGILPFIDFCMILAEKNPDRFNNKKQVFMWVE